MDGGAEFENGNAVERISSSSPSDGEETDNVVFARTASHCDNLGSYRTFPFSEVKVPGTEGDAPTNVELLLTDL